MSVTTQQVSTVRKTVLNPITLSVSNNGGTAYTYVNIFKIKGVLAITNIIFKNETFTSNPLPSGLYPWTDVGSIFMGNQNNFSFRPVLRSAGSVLPLSNATSLINYFKKNTSVGPTPTLGSNIINPISQGHYLDIRPTSLAGANAIVYPTLPLVGTSVSSVGYLQTLPATDYYQINLTGPTGPFSQSDIVTNGLGVFAQVIAYNAHPTGNYLLVRTPTGGSFSPLDGITATTTQYIDIPPTLFTSTILNIVPITAVGQGQLLDGQTQITGPVFEADSLNDTYWSLEFIYNSFGTLGVWNPWIGTYTPTIFWTPISADADILQP